MSYSKKTIKYLIDKIADQDFVLPAIQREFVWKAEQIEKLFDSLMRGYPIGSFLFWNIKQEHVKDFQFYGFLSKYHARDHKHNPEVTPSGSKPITAILDGQQRLTSLYIGLKGSYAEKKKNIKYNNPKAYPEKFLYLNLLGIDNVSDEEVSDMLYEFKFLTQQESQDVSKLWFKVSDILKINLSDYIYDELDHLEKQDRKNAHSLLNQLKNVIEDKEIINYFEETEQDLDKVLNIFIRVNNQGTPLSYSDLLLSTATALWSEHNAREEILELVDTLNNKGMQLNTDFVMKSCLMLTDLDVKFLVGNFTKSNMEIIEKQWDSIKTSLDLAVSLLQLYGYNDQYLPAYNALLPIAYYLKIAQIDYDKFLTHKDFQKDRETIIKWTRRAFIKQIFSGGSDATLSAYREIIKKHYRQGFPLEEIEKRFKGRRQDVSFTDENIIDLLDTTSYKNKKHLYSVMTAIFPVPNHALEMSIDHMFPKSSFTPKNLHQWGFKSEVEKQNVLYWVNNIANLQYLEVSYNKAKSAQEFNFWLKSQEDYFVKNQLIPKMDNYSPEQFVQFCEKRYQLLLKNLKNNL